MVWKSGKLAQRRREVLQPVWIASDTNGNNWAKRSDPYIKHFQHLIPNNRETAALDPSNAPEEVVNLVDLVKQSVKSNTPVRDIANQILSANLLWLSDNNDLQAACSVLLLVVELWLFLDLQSCALDEKLDDVVRSHLQQSVRQPVGFPVVSTMLSRDISARSLTRKAGFCLMWTSNLAEHLLVKGDKHLYIFCHAQVLAQYQRGTEKAMYPDRFLEEVSRTLDLLFPTGRVKDAKRVRKTGRKQKVDIEAILVDKQIHDAAKYQCGSYQFFGERLAIIQEKYDAARPHHLREWWFDRRNLREWAALWIAVVAFVLALIFGVISSITGIMQVYASFYLR